MLTNNYSVTQRGAFQQCPAVHTIKGRASNLLGLAVLLAAVADPVAAAVDRLDVTAHLPDSGILPYACVEAGNFILPLTVSGQGHGTRTVQPQDEFVIYFRDLFSFREMSAPKEVHIRQPVDESSFKGKTFATQVTLRGTALRLQPGAYHVMVDVVRGERSLCNGHVGSTLLYVKAPDESPQHILASMALAQNLFTRNLRAGGFFHYSNTRLPQTLDPLDVATFPEFAAQFARKRKVAPETHTDGGLGLLYMAKAYRAMGETARAEFAEQMLKWMLDGCFNFYMMRCGGAGVWTEPGPWRIGPAYDPDGPIDGEIGPEPLSRWGCRVSPQRPIWTVDLPQQIEVESVTISFGQDPFVVADFETQISADGQTWERLHEVTGNEKVSLTLDSRDSPRRQARLLRIRFLSDPADGETYVLDEVRVEGTAGGGGATKNWATLQDDALARATETFGPRGNFLDSDQSAGILQLAVRAALYFRKHDPAYASALFRRCRRPAYWIVRRSSYPNPKRGLPLRRVHIELGARRGRIHGWVGYDGRVLEGVAWYCAAYPTFHGNQPPAELVRPVKDSRDRILALLAEHHDEYWRVVGPHAQKLAQQYVAGGLLACAAAEHTLEQDERAKETLAAVGRMIKKLTLGYPRDAHGRPHRPRSNAGDTGPHFFYTVVEYLRMLDRDDPLAQDYIRHMADFIWHRCLDNSMLMEAGHRAAVPSVALWFCPEHVRVLQSQ